MEDSLNALQSKIYKNVDDFATQLSIWKSANEKIVFTNGCFDILHLGHVDYLSKAANLGTKLIIGLNSDVSTHQLKGPTRPINNQISRASLLAAFFFIDDIIIFDEPTPINLITSILPNFLVKGADYQIADIVGAREVLANGGEVKTITYLAGYSTTAIEQRIIHAHK